MTTDTAGPNATIIVTAYNHQGWVEQCLDSVLAQTRQPAAVIVVDDLSTDDTVAVVRHWLDRHDVSWSFIPHARNVGVCATMNEALALVESSHYLHISADDWLDPDRVERQLEVAATATPETGFVVGDLREVDGGGATLALHDIGTRLEGLTGPEGRDALFLRLLTENIIPAPTALVRTAAAREVGGYDETLSFEDYDLWLRLARRFPVAYGSGIASAYRLLPSSLSRSPERLKVYRRSEVAALRKQSGYSPEGDAIIHRRIAALEAQLHDELSSARRAGRPARRRARTRRG